MGKFYQIADLIIGLDESFQRDMQTAVLMRTNPDGTVELLDAKQVYRNQDDFIDGEASDVTGQKQITKRDS